MIRSTQGSRSITNADLAAWLEELAELLHLQGASPYRVRAYREASSTIAALGPSVKLILQVEGISGLLRLPGIGHSIAESIQQLVHTGKLPLLDRLRGEDTPTHVFSSVADIGPLLAKRIHEELGIASLEELESAANDGRLAKVKGMGEKRVRAVRESLAGRLHHQLFNSTHHHKRTTAPVSVLLDIDSEYRRLAEEDQLPRIAPRKFNPNGERWLPVLHTERRDQHYTAMYSNSERAHQVGKTNDWVVIYHDDGTHDHWTAITAQFGELQGRRIICGREAECRAHYDTEATMLERHYS